MGLPATRKTATEEDRGEDNKDSDWLEGCYTEQRRLKVELSSFSCNVPNNKNVARQVAEVTCYTVQFLSSLCRNGVARQGENCTVLIHRL